MSILQFFSKRTSSVRDELAELPSTSTSQCPPPDSSQSSNDEDIDNSSDNPSSPKNTAITDIANAIGKQRQLTSNQKFHLLQHHFKPSADYSFPKGDDGRSFQRNWLTQYPWLVYSESSNGGFCLPCAVFSTTGYHSSEPGILVRKPLTNFRKSLEMLKKHSEKDYHCASVVMCDNFLKVMNNQQPAITSVLNQAVANRISINRQMLSSIIQTVILCGRQNISLRGHRDNLTDVEKDFTQSSNHGNFWALLNFRIAAGDVVLHDHLTNSPLNARYTSPGIQNEIIDVLSDQVRGKIIGKVQAAKWFTVIGDEVTDVSNKEILSLVLRYCDPDTLLIHEDLLGFFECDSGISGRALAEKITSTLKGFNLDLSYLRGQAYDGAGNMAGPVNGAAAIITREYPLALYLHCASHCLNLSIVKPLKLTSINNMMNIVGRIYQFFDSHPKRQQALEKSIAVKYPSSNVLKLQDLCRTSWIQRLNALTTFSELYDAILDCLDTIYHDGRRLWSSDAVTDAHGLQLAISNCDFISAFIITNSCLQYIHGLTISLQGTSIDILYAVKEIDATIATIQQVRDNIETYHAEWFIKIERMCATAGITPTIPRICQRQTHRSNLPAETPSQSYLRNISIPFLDHVLSELRTRFCNHQKTALLGLCLVPSILLSMSHTEHTETSTKLAELYQHDLPSHSSFNSEIDCWKVKWQTFQDVNGKASVPTTIRDTLSQTTSMYPNIKVLLRILSTLPVTTCSAERSFSSLKLTKTHFRSSMTTTRLTNLSILHIFRDIEIDIPAAIDEFARRHPRRLQMTDILSDN